MPTNLNLDDEITAMEGKLTSATGWAIAVQTLLRKAFKSTENPFGSAALKTAGSADGNVPLVGTTEGKVPVLESTGRFPSSVVPAVTVLSKATKAVIQAPTAANTVNKYIDPLTLDRSQRIMTAGFDINQSGSITQSFGYNISSYTDRGVGITRANFTRNHTDGNFSAVASGAGINQNVAIISMATSRAASYCDVRSYLQTLSLIDSYVFCQIYGTMP